MEWSQTWHRVRSFYVGLFCRDVSEFVRLIILFFSGVLVNGAKVRISYLNEMTVFNIVKSVSAPGEPGGKAVNVHTYLWLH